VHSRQMLKPTGRGTDTSLDLDDQPDKGTGWRAVERGPVAGEANSMDRLEIVRAALAEVGDVSPVELAAFAEQRFGVALDPKIVPLLKATLRDRERIAAERQARAIQASAVEPTNVSESDVAASLGVPASNPGITSDGFSVT
jgi:hypothetical protein